MLDLVKRAITRIFPELSAGLHLDRYARVTAVNDAPGEGSASERFRPRYSVDLTILTADLVPDPAFPVYTAVPLPVTLACGQESGVFAFPEPGSLAVIAFAYGRPDHPVIRQIYPLGLTLPSVQPKEVLLQQDPEVYQRADVSGGWERRARTHIKDDSDTRSISARFSETTFGKEKKTVEDSKTEVDGVYSLEAGLVDIIGALKVDAGSLGEVNLTAGTDATLSAGKNLTETVGEDKTSVIKGGRETTITKDDSLKAANVQLEATNQTIKLEGMQTFDAANAALSASGSYTISAGGIVLSSGNGLLVMGGGASRSSRSAGGEVDIFKELVGCLYEIIQAEYQLSGALRNVGMGNINNANAHYDELSSVIGK